MQTIRYLSIRCVCVRALVCVFVCERQNQIHSCRMAVLSNDTQPTHFVHYTLSTYKVRIYLFFRKLFRSLLLFAMCVIFARVSALWKRARNFQGIFPLLTFVWESKVNMHVFALYILCNGAVGRWDNDDILHHFFFFYLFRSCIFLLGGGGGGVFHQRLICHCWRHNKRWCW